MRIRVGNRPSTRSARHRWAYPRLPRRAGTIASHAQATQFFTTLNGDGLQDSRTSMYGGCPAWRTDRRPKACDATPRRTGTTGSTPSTHPTIPVAAHRPAPIRAMAAVVASPAGSSRSIDCRSRSAHRWPSDADMTGITRPLGNIRGNLAPGGCGRVGSVVSRKRGACGRGCDGPCARPLRRPAPRVDAEWVIGDIAFGTSHGAIEGRLSEALSRRARGGLR